MKVKTEICHQGNYTVTIQTKMQLWQMSNNDFNYWIFHGYDNFSSQGFIIFPAVTQIGKTIRKKFVYCALVLLYIGMSFAYPVAKYNTKKPVHLYPFGSTSTTSTAYEVEKHMLREQPQRI